MMPTWWACGKVKWGDRYQAIRASINIKCWISISYDLFYFTSRYTSNGNFLVKFPIIFLLSSFYLITLSFIWAPYISLQVLLMIDLLYLSLSNSKTFRGTDMFTGPRTAPEETFHKCQLNKCYTHMFSQQQQIVAVLNGQYEKYLLGRLKEYWSILRNFHNEGEI